MQICRVVVLLAVWPLCATALGTPNPKNSASRSSQAPKVAISEWTLPNGLRVLYAPHRRAPAVTVQVWYHVGSKNERPGVRGIAHLFEHMMFKGSEHVPPEQHARMLAAVGGSTNAFTAEDVTAYHNTVPREYLDFAMQLEAERMRHLRLTLHTIKSEREVVKEEYRMRLKTSPIGRALEAIRELAYTKHPYAWTPAGNMKDLDQITREDCQRFYDTYYLPANATLIVVGDVDEQTVRRAATQYFGPISAGKGPPLVTLQEPPQTRERQRVADWPSQLKVVLGAYHIPAARHPDDAPLTVLNAILSDGKSSRLTQRLVRKDKSAVAAGGFVASEEHPGLFMIYAVGLPEADDTKLQSALLEEVELLTQRSPSAEELEKAKNQLATSSVRRIESLDGLAYQLGNSVYVLGDPRAFLREPEDYDKVDAAAVMRVAKTYLRRENFSVIVLNRTQTGAAAKPREGK